MKLCLRVVSGLQIGDQTRLDPPGGIVGRNEGCVLQLRDDSVSRAHVELRFHQDTWWVYQRSTRSPTLVDGVPAVSAPIGLREQGVLKLGAVALEYEHELTGDEVAELESPPTMINVRHQLPAIQHTLLPQLTPMRVAEPIIEDTPATIIMRRPPPPPPEALATQTQRPISAPPPFAPPTSDQPRDQPIDQPSGQRLAQLERERDELRREREQLKAEVARLTGDNTRLRESLATLTRQLAAAPPAPAAVSPAPAHSAVKAEALHLLQPFADSLEQASEVLKAGDAAGARALIREASFGLADLRDLFESN